MTAAKRPASQEKLSSTFRKRLQTLKPHQQVRAVVLLHTEPAPPAQTRQTASERQAAIAALRNSAQQAYQAIAPILERFGGHPLASRPNALGAIPIEITAEGVKALAQSDWVDGILEDQPIQPVDAAMNVKSITTA